MLKKVFTENIFDDTITPRKSSKFKQETLLEMAKQRKVTPSAAPATAATAASGSTAPAFEIDPEVDGNAVDPKSKLKKPEKDKEFVASADSMEQTIELFKSLLGNMRSRRDQRQFHSPLLTSDPGVGKTQRLNLFATVLGIELVTIEAPHIVEEHIIHIPFIVFNPKDQKEKTGRASIDSYHIELADSYLFTTINHPRKTTDAELLDTIYHKSEDDVIALFEYFGGNETTVPVPFKQIRETYNIMLFLDEYFREVPVKIRNMLRAMLNNKIATHDIPKNIFLLYASNLKDSGLEEDIPLNTQFERNTLENPTKEEWFSWLVLHFKKNAKVQLDQKLINKFYTKLEDADISNNDAEADVRTSPRRWEQLLLYINSSLPCKDVEDARNLLSNVKLNFRNYLTGSHSKLAEKVLEATTALIKQTSNIDISVHDVNKEDDWGKTLKHQIETRKRLGTLRKYVPVIAGPPGIAKTAKAWTLAQEMDLRFIDIDVSTLNPDDIVGMPLPREDEETGHFETKFTLPVLYEQIMKRIHKGDKKYREEMKEDQKERDRIKKESPSNWEEKLAEFIKARYPKLTENEIDKKTIDWMKDADTRWAEYEKRPLKYLIFFDELNRNSPKVFNSIRRVLLEKNFGDSDEGGKSVLKLPDEAFIMGAINPEDAGAQEITTHMRDVLDVIGAAPNWKNTLEYIKSQKGSLKDVDDTTYDIACNVTNSLMKTYETKNPAYPVEQRPFNFNISSSGGSKSEMLVWFAPREITMMTMTMAQDLQTEIDFIRGKIKEDVELSTEDLRKLEDRVRKTVFKSIDKTIGFIIFKHTKEEAPEFTLQLKSWVENSPEIDIGENLFYKKSVDTETLDLTNILGDFLDGAGDHSAAESNKFIQFMENVEMNKFNEDIRDLIMAKFTDEAAYEKYLNKSTYDAKTLDEKGQKIITNTAAPKVCLMENFMREIVYALHINKISYDSFQAFYYGVQHGLKEYRKAMKDILPSEVLENVLEKYMEILGNISSVVEDELKHKLD